MFDYRARIAKVVDGDTVDVDIDLGLGVHKLERCRLRGLNAPELHSKNAAEKARGLAAKKRLAELVEGVALFVITVKDEREKYGRYLVDVLLPDRRSVNAILISEGVCKAWDGKGARPI